MSLVDFIGFIVALVAMFFMFMKRVAEERRRRSLPEEDKGQTLDEFLRSMEEGETPKRPSPPPAPPKARPRALPGTDFRPRLEGYRQESAIEKRKLKTSVEDRKLAPQQLASVQAAEAYEVIKRKKSSRGLSLINSLKQPRDMFILNEIINKPLALRHPPGQDTSLL